MQDLLTPVATRSIAKHSSEDVLPAGQVSSAREKIKIESPDDVKRVLRSQPGIEQLSEALHWLDGTSLCDGDDGFNIKAPSPKASQIISSIVSEVVPNYWIVLEGTKERDQIQLRKILVRNLTSVAGIGAISSRLHVLLKEFASQGKPEKANNVQHVEELVRVLERILEKDNLLLTLWSDLNLHVASEPKRIVSWKELVSLLAGGRILSLAAEADRIINEASSSIRDQTWLADGNKFAKWLGRNFVYAIDRLPKDDQEQQKGITQFFSRALTLGYIDHVVGSTFASILAGDGSNVNAYRCLLERLRETEQKNILFSLIRILSRILSPADEQGLDCEEKDHGRSLLAGAAALFFSLIERSTKLRYVLVQWLTGNAASSVGQGLSVHRAVVSSLVSDHQLLKDVFQRTLSQFGDKLHIKHTPILQQEVNVQILLIITGYLYRVEPSYVVAESRSSTYINSISNRLSASSHRACFLGMLVGIAVSELVDPKEKRINFSAEEIDSPEGKWYRSLTSVQDAMGSISDLKPTKAKSKDRSSKIKTKAANNCFGKSSGKQSISKIVAIEEIEGDSSSEDEDLVAYEKPDSDVSDEDEDATLVQRNKPTAPVYIRDLIAGLRDTDNYDRHRLALSNASSLIRRKATFGSEVSEHIEELATLLTGLSDKYSMEDFQRMRLQGMIAVIIAQPLRMGQWFSRTFFQGEYSMGQRASILTTLGLGARELAGLQDEDSVVTGATSVGKNPFPSKVLPDKLHKIYALEAKPLDAIVKKMEKTTIKPMAIEAADQLSGPNALKVRTFSSRMEVEKRRTKPTPNELARIVADGFFFPLTGLWRIQLQAYGDRNIHTSPFILTHYLKTLSLILHAAGTSPLSLPQMTSEFWDLLLSLRSRASDVPVLEALLFSFLTLLELNSNNQRRLAEEHAKELLETREWVQMVFEKVGGGSEEGERVRMLAAGVLTKTREVVEKYQRLLLGDLIDFM